jgi:hypothetical protein
MFNTMIRDESTANQFCETVIGTLEKAFADNLDGFKNRANMARHLKSVECEMRHQAAIYAAENSKKGSELVTNHLEHMIQTAELSGEAADAIHEPINRNLKNLIIQGRQISFAQNIAAAQAEKIQDEIHDEECDDPDCAVHFSH